MAREVLSSKSHQQSLRQRREILNTEDKVEKTDSSVKEKYETWEKPRHPEKTKSTNSGDTRSRNAGQRHGNIFKKIIEENFCNLKEVPIQNNK